MLNIRSDLHREMGSPDYTLPIWIDIEGEDTVVSDWSRIPFDTSWFPDLDAAPRL